MEVGRRIVGWGQGMEEGVVGGERALGLRGSLSAHALAWQVQSEAPHTAESFPDK